MRRCPPDSSSFSVRAIVSSVGVALGACAATALAVPPGALNPSSEDGLLPASLLEAMRARAAAGAGAGKVSSGGASGAPVGHDLGSRFGAVARGSAGADGAFSTLDTGFESLAPLPANLVNQLDTVQWGGAAAGVTGRAHFSTVTDLVPPQYGVVSDAVAGNATKKLRGFASPAFGPNTFFGRWARYNFYKTNTASPTQAGATRFVFRPDSGQNVRLVHDTYVTSANSLWTSEPTYVSSGFIIGRLIWGGENQTTGIGLPIGPIPFFYTLSESGCGPACPLFSVLYGPEFYRSGEPYPTPGEPVPLPIQTWFKIISETDVNGNILHLLDLNDGHGEFVIYNALSIQSSGRVDRMAFAGGYETEGDACYIDNLHARGVEYILPTPPPLVCESGQFRDDLEWLFPGPLRGQSGAWFDALTAGATVVVGVGAPGNQVIRRRNTFPDSLYRRENSRTLPLTYATGATGPWRACVSVSMPSAPGALNQTVQTIAPVSLTDSAFATRVFLGRYEPATVTYSPRVFVQINPLYNPIDDENSPDPNSPGPNGNGGTPVIGVDVADTGVDWLFNAFHTLCIEVSVTPTLTVLIDGVAVHTGSPFVTSIDRLDFECENNWIGANNTIDYDDVVLTCAVLPSVTLPPLTLVYNDPLDWGFAGVTIGLHDDDANPNTPFRWSSAANMPLFGGPHMLWLKMENLFRDTPGALPNDPGFIAFTQASTALPHVTASATRGWTARADMRLTDGETSRTWSVAQAVIGSTQFARVGAVTFSSITDTFWVQRMAPTMQDPFATTWVDSGAGLAQFGSGFNQNFALSLSRSVGGKITFRIHGRLLRFVGGPNNGAAVVVDPLASLANGVHKDMDRLFYFGSDEDSAPPGSILYTDNIRAWSLPCLGDTNTDGVVNFVDLNNVLGFYGQSGVDITGNTAPDANGDGVPDDDIVNFNDLNAVLSGFGTPCTATQ